MKGLKFFSYSIMALAILCIYSFFIYDVSTGGKRIGFLSEPLLKFASFPKTIETVLNSPEVKNIPEAYLPMNAGFQTINKLDQDLFGLTSFWNNRSKRWDIQLVNLKNDSIFYNWEYKQSNYKDDHYQFSNARLMHSAIVGHKNIIIKAEQTPNLIRLDSNSNVVWINNAMRFHHSINFDADSNIFVCASDILPKNGDCYPGGLVKNLDDRMIAYREDYITKIDIESGEILWKKGVGEILLENDLKGYLYGFELWDPIHLNDIQPVLKDSDFWEKDDLFLSVRDRSMVLLYRPSTNKIIKIINGPFISQHDVDIVSDHEISIWNNNYIFSIGYGCATPSGTIDSLNYSELLIYDFINETYRSIVKREIEKENIKSNLEGQTERLSDGSLFIEEHNTGRYFLINEEQVIIRKVWPTNDANYIHMPNWMRLYEKLPI